ncbi:hypothetical protein QTP88_007664 [Uroleucon formosanum]
MDNFESQRGSELIENSVGTRETPSQILSTIVHNIPNDTAVAVGNFSSLKRNIRNYRHRYYLLKEPINSDFNIPEEWKTKMGAEPRLFMIFDTTTRIERTRFESNIHNTLTPKSSKKNNTLQDKLHNEYESFLNNEIQIGQFLYNIAKFCNYLFSILSGAINHDNRMN